MAEEANVANSPAEDAGENAGENEETTEGTTEETAEETAEDVVEKAEEGAEDKSEDKAEETDESTEEDKSDAPSEEDDVPKGYHNDPKMQKYVKKQSEKAIAEAKEIWDADNKTEEKPSPDAPVDKVAIAQTKLEKAYESGTAKEMAQSQADLNTAQIDARIAQAGVVTQARQAADVKTEEAINTVKSEMTESGIKDIDGLDKYLQDVDRSRGKTTIERVRNSYKIAAKIRAGEAKAKISGEKNADKKKKSTTPGKPASESGSGLYKPGMDADDIAKASESIT